MGRPTIAAFLRIDRPEERTSYPQVGNVSDSSSPSVQAVYWRAAAVFYASSYRLNPDSKHVLFTNARPPIVDGHDLAAFFRELEVELRDVPFTFRPPEGYFALWGTQFYILDVLRALAEDPANFPLLAFDIDCVFAGPGDALWDSVAVHGVANYIVENIDADPTWPSNGLTTVELQQVSEEIAGRKLARVRYCGGEIVGFSWPVAKDVIPVAEKVWRACLERHTAGARKLNTEEHVFSCVYAMMGLPVGTVNGLLRRVWTQRSYSDVRASDLELQVWHVPAEKRYGLRRLYADVLNPRSNFWTLPVGGEYRRYLGSRLGIPSASLKKKVLDGLFAVRERAPF